MVFGMVLPSGGSLMVYCKFELSSQLQSFPSFNKPLSSAQIVLGSGQNARSAKRRGAQFLPSWQPVDASLLRASTG
jgi:hypothetical protein